MIYDSATEVLCAFPVAGTEMTYSSTTYELTAGNDGVPQLFAGEQLYMQFEISVAPVVDTGTPMAQFGIAFDTASVLTTTSHVLAMTGGSIAGNVGIDSGQMTLGRTFCLAIPPWEDIMEITAAAWPDTNTAATLATFRTMKYMGIVIQQSLLNSDDHFWTDTGRVKARITHTPASTAVTSNIYPSRMRVL